MTKSLKFQGHNQVITILFAFVSRGGAAGLQLLINVALGRILGPAGLSVYFIYFSWLNVLAVVFGLGFPILVLRNVSTLLNSVNGIKQARMIWQKTLLISALVSGLSIFVLYIFRYPIAALLFKDASLSYIVVYMAWSGFAFALISICADTLKAQNRANWGLNLQFSLPPFLLLIYLFLSYFLDSSLDSKTVILGSSICLSITMLAAIYYADFGFGKFVQVPEKNLDAEVKIELSWFDTSRFMAINILRQVTVQMPFLMLPFLIGAHEIGLFGAANRLIGLTSIILIATSSIFSPLYARAFARLDFKALQHLLRQSQVYSFLAFTPLLLIFGFFGKWTLELFGASFGEASSLLLILVLGQSVNAATGLSTHFNYMTKQETFEIYLNIVVLMVLLGAGIIFTKSFGIIGFAWVVSFSLALKNILSYYQAAKVLRLQMRVSK